MKYLTSILIALCLLCSCKRNNDEPPTETLLPIAESYLPATVAFHISDSDWIEATKEWADKKIIVNELSELPTDPLGFSDAYKAINFNEYTLLIYYDIHNWKIDTYRNQYYHDNIKNTYNWTIRVRTANIPDGSSEQWYFTRYAILVKKLPADADITIWLSVGLLIGGWD